MVFIEGILPRKIEIKRPPVIVQRVSVDARTARFASQAQPQNHASKDRGNQLKVNPTARSRRGNGR